jgi:hypothetical protein
MLVILDPIELFEGESAWSLDLRTGALAGTMHLPPEAPPDSTPTFYLWERGDLRCLAPIVPDSAGKFRCARVPAGHARIVRYDPARGFDETSPETLATLDLPAGETRTIEIR